MAVATPPPSIYISLAIAVLVAWRVYVRVRRLVGRQKLVRARPWLTLAVFPVLWLLLAFASARQPLNLAALLAGALAGAGLGVYGLRLTKFEETPEGRFYTPSAHLGIALSLLFVGRVVFRFLQLWLLLGPGHASGTDFARSPVTLAIFGTLGGYYVAYAIGLVRWSRTPVVAA